ncbi:50S ribosomal protein L21 [Candidatus Karelsulcia muelleri]
MKACFACFEALGNQFVARKEKDLYLPFLKLEKIGQQILLQKIILFINNGKVKIGRPYLKNIYILAEVIGHSKGKKIIVFKKKRRKGYKLKKGHRQKMTKIKIISIVKRHGT